MNLATDAIIRIATELAKYENMRVTVKESIQGGLVTGICTVAGGLLGGRTGLLLGSALGTALCLYSGNEFKSVVYIIRDDMTPAEQRKLAKSLRSIFKKIVGPVTLTAIIGNPKIRSSASSAIRQFIKKMGYIIAERT